MQANSQDSSQEPQVRVPEFPARVSELLDISEMAHNLANASKAIEQKLLGFPDGDQNTPLVEPDNVGVSINNDLALYIENIKSSLQRISDSLSRLNSEV